jgi:hypothetical protein
MRKAVERERADQEYLRVLFSDRVVRNGPFKGMVYAQAFSTGSEYYPKLLGSYEAELHEHIERILQDDYTVYVDIGCAEGYYAVGLALRKPRAVVYAFDIDSRARDLCYSNAIRNGVSGRVKINAYCDGDVLLKLDLGMRAFILCDCEGYELALFAQETVSGLARHDLVIEIHDFIDIDIRDTLIQRFESTHEVSIVNSVDDYIKADIYVYPELAKLTRNQRKMALSERRPCIMQWLILKSRFRVAQQYSRAPS